ncbi:MarR family protein [Enhygromyxa salina]|uniref:MarR family protein n=1 Tax=Enhygromyxa salina TaxID=215803 RepID=A0A2S9XDK1_9BACT|nr:winged helix-turn-helix domain-containing protein [Enhygromyxa salina]PRP90936.1 MarR family protein [Enhygromyxa salina]
MASANNSTSDGAPKSWTFLSNHAHVLVCLARDPDMRLRDVAAQVRLTERAVHRIVKELETAGVITRLRDGRRNHYELDPTVPLRHPLEVKRTVGSLLEMLLEPAESKRLGLRRRRKSDKASSG